eukprot:504966-Rhodomonas_salina.3
MLQYRDVRISVRAYSCFSTVSQYVHTHASVPGRSYLRRYVHTHVPVPGCYHRCQADISRAYVCLSLCIHRLASSSAIPFSSTLRE